MTTTTTTIYTIPFSIVDGQVGATGSCAPADPSTIDGQSSAANSQVQPGDDASDVEGLLGEAGSREQEVSEEMEGNAEGVGAATGGYVEGWGAGGAGSTAVENVEGGMGMEGDGRSEGEEVGEGSGRPVLAGDGNGEREEGGSPGGSRTQNVGKERREGEGSLQSLSLSSLSHRRPGKERKRRREKMCAWREPRRPTSQELRDWRLMCYFLGSLVARERTIVCDVQTEEGEDDGVRIGGIAGIADGREMEREGEGEGEGGAKGIEGRSLGGRDDAVRVGEARKGGEVGERTGVEEGREGCGCGGAKGREGEKGQRDLGGRILRKLQGFQRYCACSVLDVEQRDGALLDPRGTMAEAMAAQVRGRMSRTRGRDLYMYMYVCVCGLVGA